MSWGRLAGGMPSQGSDTRLCGAPALTPPSIQQSALLWHDHYLSHLLLWQPYEEGKAGTLTHLYTCERQGSEESGSLPKVTVCC